MKPDTTKLIELSNLIHDKYQIITQIDSFLLFDNRNYTHKNTVSEYEAKIYKIHRPDITFYKNNKLYLIEIDGYIHDENSKVQKKTAWRNADYDYAGIPYLVINEKQILEAQNITRKVATATEVFPYIVQWIDAL